MSLELNLILLLRVHDDSEIAKSDFSDLWDLSLQIMVAVGSAVCDYLSWTHAVTYTNMRAIYILLPAVTAWSSL